MVSLTAMRPSSPSSVIHVSDDDDEDDGQPGGLEGEREGEDSDDNPRPIKRICSSPPLASSSAAASAHDLHTAAASSRPVRPIHSPSLPSVLPSVLLAAAAAAPLSLASASPSLSASSLSSSPTGVGLSKADKLVLKEQARLAKEQAKVEKAAAKAALKQDKELSKLVQRACKGAYAEEEIHATLHDDLRASKVSTGTRRQEANANVRNWWRGPFFFFFLRIELSCFSVLFSFFFPLWHSMLG